MKMVISLAKCTILNSWSPISMSLILASASVKITSTSATIMHNNSVETLTKFLDNSENSQIGDHLF